MCSNFFVYVSLNVIRNHICLAYSAFFISIGPNFSPSTTPFWKIFSMFPCTKTIWRWICTWSLTFAWRKYITERPSRLVRLWIDATIKSMFCCYPTQQRNNEKPQEKAKDYTLQSVLPTLSQKYIVSSSMWCNITFSTSFVVTVIELMFCRVNNVKNC